MTRITLRELPRPDVVFASSCGIGFIPHAPGTWGAAVATLLWWPIASTSLWTQLAGISLCFLLGWWCSARICQRYDVEDAPQIVADEVVGMWIALVALPTIWWLWLSAFVLFRIADIAKPGPIGWLDRNVKGGLGVMLDDVLAGVLTGGVLYVSISVMQRMGMTV